MTRFYSIPPQLYDDQFWWKKDDIEFWKNNLLSSSDLSILEIACGTGRLAEPLLREGANYHGLEISEEYLQFAKSKLNKYIQSPSIYLDDMRSFKLNKKFDIIFIGFNSLLHLLNKKELYSFLSCIKEHMHSKSVFYLDVLIPKDEFLYRDNKRVKIMSFVDTLADSPLSIYEELEYNRKTEIADIRWEYLYKNKIKYLFEFQMKMFYPDTINQALVDNEFSIDNLWGDYNEAQIYESSDLQIYKCSNAS